ncbi:hypothetical protein [Deinococcus maricopensis]|uniref:LytTr DNA-binding region n=1 Tax=Deinococcus maricopensis (strain DSM 21211 / LMG 22137 / NRRL B-23946 / LB-34) TaxID=709986 RepID=E8UAY8_DEIML|nr:hypothetical protein [Deinococcus maricopensis]ADV68227.1 LytTr DNA-binding region [Deinococcus maricopensis DSM 21211]
MNERMTAVLREAGFDGGGVRATLDHPDAFFALTDRELAYHDAGGLRRVNLPDVTRIHSDRDGVLRVETANGTALTASLLGFVPAQVQSFFQEVRDVTARAKNQPAPPNTAPKPFVAPAAAPAPRTAPTPAPVAPAPAPAATTVTVSPSVREVRAAPEPATATPDRTPEPVSPAPDPAPSAPRPIVISSTPVTSSADDVNAPRAGGTVATPGIAAALASGELAQAASSAEGYVGAIRALAVVLGLAALGVAFMQWRNDQALAALWVLASGGVAAIALLMLASVTRLLVAVARQLPDRDA